MRTARALVDLPETSASMARGELSFSKVRALTRVATTDNEGELLEYAQGSTTAQLERFVRGFRLGSAKTEAEIERIRHASRRFAVFPGDDGMYGLAGRLDPEIGALLMRAIEAAGDALYREDDSTSPEQRRADALALVAERAMAAGFVGKTRGRCHADTGDEGDPAEPAAGNEAPLSGTRAERHQVMLHVDTDTLKRNGEGVHSHLEDGTYVYLASLEELAEIRAAALRAEADRPLGSAETSRRLTCDASVVRIVHGKADVRAGGQPHRCDGQHRDGSLGPVLDVGRRTRTIPPAIRRALDARDCGCRFPGCGSRFNDGHHLRHWIDGGETKLSNLLLLCPHHHRLLHEGGFHVELNDWPGGRVTFYDPRGVPVPEVPPKIRVTAARERRAGRLGGGPGCGEPSGTAGDAAAAEEHVETATLETATRAPTLETVSPETALDPVDALLAQNRAAGADPDWNTAGASWKQERDVPDGVWVRASEVAG